MARKAKRKKSKFEVGEEVRVVRGDDRSRFGGRTGSIAGVDYVTPRRYLLNIRPNRFAAYEMTIDRIDPESEDFRQLLIWFEEADLDFDFGLPAWTGTENPTA